MNQHVHVIYFPDKKSKLKTIGETFLHLLVNNFKSRFQSENIFFFLYVSIIWISVLNVSTAIDPMVSEIQYLCFNV